MNTTTVLNETEKGSIELDDSYKGWSMDTGHFDDDRIRGERRLPLHALTFVPTLLSHGRLCHRSTQGCQPEWVHLHLYARARTTGNLPWGPGKMLPPIERFMNDLQMPHFARAWLTT